jgi:two-component system chemotaxis sensor kinase CheA
MMVSEEITQKVEALSEALVLAEPSDRQSLASLHTLFEELAHLANEESEPEVGKAAGRAAGLIEEIILEEARDEAAAMESLGDTVSALQQLIRGSGEAAEVWLPPEEEPEAKPHPENGSSRPNRGRIIHPSSLPANVDEAMFCDFLARQTGVLEEMECLLLAMEKSDDDSNLGELRRLIHTMKGDSALVGLTDVERLCHALEDLLDRSETKEAIDGMLSAKDWLSRTFGACAGREKPPGDIEGVLEQLATGAAAHCDGTVTATPGAPSDGDGSAGAVTQLEGDLGLMSDFVVEAKEHLETADVHLLNLETNPDDDEAINAVFRAFHTIKGLAGFLGLDEIGALAHEAENLLDRARKKDISLFGSTMDVTFDAVDALKKLVNNVQDSLTSSKPLAREESLPHLLERIRAAIEGKVEAAPEPASEGAQGKQLGEILVESGTATEGAVEAALEQQRRERDDSKLGKVLVREYQAEAKDIARALRAQQSAGPQQSVSQIKEAIKVDAGRLDRLVDTIGELVIAESMITQSAQLRVGASASLARQLNQLDKITRELQELGTSLRMVPLRSTFQRMARLVRDLARKANKSVEFAMVGEETELDKTVVDRIGDPLVHMVRNAVDHGIEGSTADRVKAGKPETGRVTLRAFHKGGNIYIEIKDDGRGLSREAIIAKAREKGLIGDESVLSDREVYNLIFTPGFSTARTITDVSGRGVGMDVVRRNIEALRGQVEISSEPGGGSTFTMRLPLTLAIIDGMVVRLGTERYIIPTLSIVRSVRPRLEDLSTVLDKGEMLSLQGKLIPLFRLDRVFGIEGARQEPCEALVVVVEEEGRQIGLLTDELVGQQQIVIKSLGESLQGVAGLAGAAIMSDGQVGLILDVSSLLRIASTEDIDSVFQES